MNWHYLTLKSQSISLPSPSAITGWKSLAQHWICLKRTKDGVHSIQSFMLTQTNYCLWKELFPAFFPLYCFLKAINLLFPHISYPSRIGSASDDEPMRKLSLLFCSIGRLLDWVESLPRHKGSDLSESPNGGRENILIESSTVLNSEKDFSKFDQIDRESHHLLGGLTDRPSWAERPCHRTFL